MAGRQQRELAEPFPPKLVHTVNKGGRSESYVPWTTVSQRLIHILGGYNFSIANIQWVDTTGEGFPTRVIVHGSLMVMVDGDIRTVDNVGTSDGYRTKEGKWIPPDDKTAASDALKRCAVHLGLGMHLWAGKEYWLDKQLDQESIED